MSALPTLKQLRHLAALEEHRHFARAADACHVTQSTLSASIRELEAALGAPVVDRSQPRCALTPLGLEAAERARLLLADAAALVDLARAATQPLTGQLRLGVIPTIGPFLLPRVLPRLRRQRPQLRLFLNEDLTGNLLAELRAGRLDAILAAWPIEDEGVDSRTLFVDRFLLACAPEHAFARRRTVATSDLAGEPLLLLKEGHCLRQHALSACAASAPRHLQQFEATSLLTLAQMAANGLGVTLLPELAAADLARGSELALRPFADDPPAREVRLGWRAGSPRRDELLLLADELLAAA